MVKIRKRHLIFVVACTFIWFYIFFSIIHPIVLSDTDDFTNCIRFRNAIPLWGSWNPIKVFPELSMPIASKIALYIINPICGDIFRSYTVAYAFAVAFVLSVFSGLVLIFFSVTYRKWKLNIVFTLIFWLMHFWIFRSKEIDNVYMLGTIDATTYFHYVIPNVMNCAVVLVTVLDNWYKGELFDSTSIKYKAFFLVFIYYCLFSNIVSSVITASFYTSIIVLEQIKNKKRISLRNVIGVYKYKLLFLLLWLISLAFEKSGGRARAAGKKDFIVGLKNVVVLLIEMLSTVNKSFLITVLLIIVVGFYCVKKEKLIRIGEIIKSMIVSSVLNLSFIILLCTNLEYHAVQRPDYLYGIFFFFVMIVLLLLSAIILRYSKIIIILPLAISLILFNIETTGRTFVESTLGHYDTNMVLMVDKDMMNQIVDAENNGELSISIIVPKYDSEDNWPFPTNAGKCIADFFYENRVVNEYVEVTSLIPVEKE